MLQSIYTHAGCDYGCLYTYSPRHCFNPHTHAGCDNVHNVSGASFPVSIHTPTQGVTFLYICNVFRICFNPHTHAGCDNPLPRLTRVHNRFNPHTHAGCDYCKDNKCKGSPDKPGGLSIQLCKSEKKEFYIRYSS